MIEKNVAMKNYARTKSQLGRYYDRFFTDTNLTSAQATVLYYIMTVSPIDGGNDVFPKDLEIYLDLKKPSVSSLLNYLEQDGYIRRETVPYDGRYRKLVLTDKSRAMREDILKRIEAYRTSVFEGISEDEYVSLFWFPLPYLPQFIWGFSTNSQIIAIGTQFLRVQAWAVPIMGVETCIMNCCGNNCHTATSKVKGDDRAKSGKNCQT